MTLNKFQKTLLIIAIIIFTISLGVFSYQYLLNMNIKDEPLNNWQATQIVGFNLLLPSGCSHVPLQGIDSNVGEIRCPTFTLSYDYGYYSSDLSEFYSNNSNYNITYENIDKKEAKIISPRTYPGTVGIYFDRIVEPTPVTDSEFPLIGFITKLQINGMVDSNNEQDIVLQILHSIEFE